MLKLTGNKLLENLAERARIRKTIRDMLEEEEETQNLGAQLNFRILQQAQGFAANVMSNLIPAAAAAGTVAGPAVPATGPAALGVPSSLQQQAAISAGQLGVSRGQGNETNSILRDILASWRV